MRKTEKHWGNDKIIEEQWWIQGKNYCHLERVSGGTDSRRTAEHRKTYKESEVIREAETH